MCINVWYAFVLAKHIFCEHNSATVCTSHPLYYLLSRNGMGNPIFLLSTFSDMNLQSPISPQITVAMNILTQVPMVVAGVGDISWDLIQRLCSHHHCLESNLAPAYSYFLFSKLLGIWHRPLLYSIRSSPSVSPAPISRFSPSKLSLLPKST